MRLSSGPVRCGGTCSGRSTCRTSGPCRPVGSICPSPTASRRSACASGQASESRPHHVLLHRRRVSSQPNCMPRSKATLLFRLIGRSFDAHKQGLGSFHPWLLVAQFARRRWMPHPAVMTVQNQSEGTFMTEMSMPTIDPVEGNFQVCTAGFQLRLVKVAVDRIAD